MKRIMIVTLCMIFLLNGCGIKEVYELSSTEGRMLICNNDTFMLIADGSPIALNVDELKDIDKYTDGDLIRVWHDGVEETYPARTKVYKVKLIEKGSMADLDENVVRNLCDMGWIEYDDMVDRYMEADYIIDCETPDNSVKCRYLNCDMSLEIPDTWTYEVKESDDECYIRFRPEDEYEGWVVLQCTPSQFAVCGTGLSSAETEINGYKAYIGIYDNNKEFSFIRFDDVAGEYVVRNMQNTDWFSAYEKEIMSILDTVILSPDQMSIDEISKKLDKAVSGYDTKYIWFDCFEGVWHVDVYIDGIRYNYKLNTEGDIIYGPEVVK